ncbi:sterol carrier family protein [Nocardiopsis algeriensis]|uniref:sterol carrier family protein n=1 Tax=Nocardiopsis algeriensis TaxID=1478215 RepID=UPI003B42EC65
MPSLTPSLVRRLREALDTLGEPCPDGEEEAVLACARAVLRAGEPPRAAVRTAVRASLAMLADSAPGRALEVRVPPFGAVQAVEGPSHTRGTPPGVVETDPTTWLRLAVGDTAWEQAVAEHAVQASGTRADLSGHLPLRPRVASRRDPGTKL